LLQTDGSLTNQLAETRVALAAAQEKVNRQAEQLEQSYNLRKEAADVIVSSTSFFFRIL
jgi:hypothetical protein